MSETSEADDLMALDMEYRLTIAHRIDCECAPYFAQRREVLIPAVLKQAKATDADPVDLFADFARKVHQRHGGVSLGKIAALMALIHDGLDPARPASPQSPASGEGGGAG